MKYVILISYFGILQFGMVLQNPVTPARIIKATYNCVHIQYTQCNIFKLHMTEGWVSIRMS